MRQSILVLFCWAAVLAGCAKAGPDLHAEAAELAQQGKLEEAAAKVDLICAFTPGGDPCRESSRRAAELRIQAADKAMSDGRFGQAERLFIAALVTADAPMVESATQRLASEDLKQGLAYERALAGGEKRSLAKAMEAIAATKVPVAAQAKGWLDKERPGLLVAAVNAGCGPAHEGSCSKAAAELRALGATGPEGSPAIALAEEEERRVYQVRLNAEAFLKNFAARSKIEKLATECKAAKCAGQPETEICSSAEGSESEPEKRDKQRVNESVWRKAMKVIADPSLVSALEDRKKKAIDSGEIDKLDIPKPKPAPKK
jgi:hypothetical protein